SALLFAHLKGVHLVFMNGRFDAKLSCIGTLPAGVQISSLADAISKGSPVVEKHLGHYVQLQDNALAALNTAFFLDGGFIHVPANVSVPEPVRMLFISKGLTSGATVQPRNLIIAEAGAALTVIEQYVSLDDSAYCTNAVTELVSGDNTNVEHIKLQDEPLQAYHLATLHGHFGRTSNVSAHSIALGSRLSRNTIRTKLAGAGLECILNGLYLTRGEQLADHHMVVEHVEPNCASHEYFNGILDDKSKGVFHGRILVQQLAQKTDAKQTNKNLLLSDDATADTKQQLEIYADDVKCTHGATIGQINEESIFYLRARGIGFGTAKRMLIHAFAGEIIDRVKHEAVREELDKLVWDRLEAIPSLATT
ncbi:MAG TPA: Fe-S cluster assembly protein SufD, partial [Roseimicrobium sp.]|nr:Fe-S cluster assembly protein SufD [Roseimicrobium sp.]